MKSSNNINRNNYENYVIDFIDGTLNAIEEACFIAFLDDNPDIKENIDDLDTIAITPDDQVYTEKTYLKKTPVISVLYINEDNYEEYFIAYHEGDLVDSETATLMEFLETNNHLRKEFLIFANLKVEPDPAIIFNQKDSLIKKRRISPIWYSAAASILILISLSWFFSNNITESGKHEFTSINGLQSKADDLNVSLNVSTYIAYNNRQISIIKMRSYEEPDHTSDDQLTYYPDVKSSYIEPRIESTELINVRDFARLVSRPESGHTLIHNSDFDNALAYAGSDDLNIKKEKRGLLSKVIGKQIAKLKQRTETKSTNKLDTHDPGYIKVIDKSLLVFNTLTGNETSTRRTYNRNGDLTSYQIEGQELLLSKNLPSFSSQ